MNRSVTGTAAALASTALLTVAMLPLRSHLSVATSALVLVVPVVIGVVTGGARMNVARATARRQEREIRQLFELSDLLVEDKPLDVLLSVIVTTLADVFGSRQVALFLPSAEQLEIASSTGDPFPHKVLRRVLPAPGEVAESSARDGLLTVALAAAGRPVGLLVLSGDVAARHDREPLMLFANQVALAVERSQLREQALRARVTEEMAALAKTLVAAVSHDLRTPLASIKASSSTLADAALDISPEAVRRLASLIDAQADRLASLVQNLLDMSRIQAGVLQPRRTVASLADLVASVVRDAAPGLRGRSISVELPADLPSVHADLVLIDRVLTNLVDNAIRYSPKDSPITIRATVTAPQTIEVCVTDHGPGVRPEQRNEVFELFARRADDAGAGLGLNIAKTFIEAHGERIWAADAPGGGAQFCFTLPVAALEPEEPRVAADSRH
jgi:two-component system sensor histidine kinase KdpD